MKYYLKKDGASEIQGPFSFEKIKMKFEKSLISKDHLIRDSNLKTDWVKL